MKKILLLQKGEGRKTQQSKIKERVEEAGFSFRILELKTDDFVKEIEEWISENEKPAATIRWDEHGNVFGRLQRFRDISRWGYKNSVAPISIDFAYFNHYSGFMFDLLDKEGNTSVKREWKKIENDLLPMEQFPGKTGDYINLVRRIYDKHEYFKSLRHTTANFDIAAWSQCLMNNCRLMKSNKPQDWMDRLVEIFGSSIIFKLQPSPFNDKKINLEGYRTMSSRANIKIMNQSIEQNASVIANARLNITNTSGVSSEILIAKKPLITTGESWFTGLGVFHEPRNWQELEHMANEVVEDRLSDEQAFNRLKLANWWRIHQCNHGEPSNILERLIKEFKERN
tara:strand:+ start:1691 stop:2713 length:1023 start_codon:yes stop_codon:yes gene_type:complete